MNFQRKIDNSNILKMKRNKKNNKEDIRINSKGERNFILHKNKK